MSAISDTITTTIARLIELNGIIAREPTFQNWHFAGAATIDLVQLFPVSREISVEQRQAEAKAIARAFGGEWERDIHDGSWRSTGTAPFKVILHYVDREWMPTMRAIDLREPVVAPAPVAEEPTAAPATPDEVREEEHHLAQDGL